MGLKLDELLATFLDFVRDKFNIHSKIFLHARHYREKKAAVRQC